MTRRDSAPLEPPEGMLPDHPSVAWYHACQRARAKGLPLSLELLEIFASVLEEMGSSGVALIEPHRRVIAKPSQHEPAVQTLTPAEEEFMEVFDALGPLVSAQRLATELDCSAQSLRSRELHRLCIKGVIEAIHGRGYQRRKP